MKYLSQKEYLEYWKSSGQPEHITTGIPNREPSFCQSKKQAYTDYIVKEISFGFFIYVNYRSLSRKEKKRIKKNVERCCHYNSKKKRVTRFNILMLSRPIPKVMGDIFSIPNRFPASGNSVCVFVRPKIIDKNLKQD